MKRHPGMNIMRGMLLGLSLAAAACGGHGAHATAAGTAPRSSTEMPPVQPEPALRGDAFDTPAPVSVAEAAKAADGGGHEGHHTHSAAAAPRDTPAAATAYTCPMHPEVTSDKAGNCPKCGMVLVPKK